MIRLARFLWHSGSASYHFITLDAIDLAPGVHNPAVVGGNDGNDINTLVGKGLAVLDVRWQVVGLAARGESTRDREEDNLLACPFLAGIVFLGTTASSWVSIGDGCPSVTNVLA